MHDSANDSPLDLEAVVDGARMNAFHARVIALCALLAMLDGFDTQAIAFVAPEIAASWHVASSTFGAVFGLGLFGGLLGAIAMGSAGDRFGRKPVLLVATLVFAIGSLLSPSATSIGTLALARFVTGIGLGGALPGVLALTSEYAPRRWRTSVVGWMFCGFPLGAVLGGAAASRLIPAFGWPSVFVAGGLLPLLVWPLVALFIPESIRFLALRGRADAIERVLRRMGCLERWDRRVAAPARASQAPVASLFAESRAVGTLLLWATLFLSLLLTYFLVNWIPVVARQAGLPIQAAVIAVAMLNLGAILGCIAIGALADRGRPALSIGAAFALGAFAIAAIGQVVESAPLLWALAFAAGACSVGAQMCTVALCAGFYDTRLRATGIGWAMGVGRIGAIAGPVLGGVMLGAGLEPQRLFLLVGVISLGAAVAVFAVGRERRTNGPPAPALVSGPLPGP